MTMFTLDPPGPDDLTPLMAKRIEELPRGGNPQIVDDEEFTSWELYHFVNSDEGIKELWIGYLPGVVPAGNIDVTPMFIMERLSSGEPSDTPRACEKTVAARPAYPAKRLIRGDEPIIEYKVDTPGDDRIEKIFWKCSNSHAGACPFPGSQDLAAGWLACKEACPAGLVIDVIAPEPLVDPGTTRADS